MTELEIANMALSNLGMSKVIANLEIERSAEAEACRAYMSIARKACSRDFHWPQDRKIVALSLVEEDPNTEWAFSYRYPSDCEDLRRILSGFVIDNKQSRIPYIIGRDNDGRLIFTNQNEAVAEYSSVTTSPDFNPMDFNIAWSFRLSYYIVPRITGKDNRALRKDMLDLYNFELAKAKQNAAREEFNVSGHESESIRSRDSDLINAR